MQEPPDIWCAEEIVGRCGGSGPYSHQAPWDPVLLVKTASTNDVARDQARKGRADRLSGRRIETDVRPRAAWAQLGIARWAGTLRFHRAAT